MRFLGKYDSVGVLGRGSMGQVHAARAINDPETMVVVKVMRPDVAATPRARRFFDREIQYTARLNHPYIVRVLEAGVDPASGPCIVMELVPGITLEHLLKSEKRFLPERAARLTGCLCHALDSAHAAAVIHRDVKPANLMVVNAGTAHEYLKVMDFGLAHLTSKPLLSEERFAGSTEVSAQGTPAYISPEQLRGDPIDGRADLYSVGVVLYEMLTGRLPFPDDDIDALVDAHLRRSPPRFASLGIGDIPGAMEDVVHHCLAKFAAERPASARALVIELGEAMAVDLWADTIPVADAQRDEEVPPVESAPVEPIAPPNTIVRRTEAWMPDQIAIVKLGGFLTDAGGKLIKTRPGLLKARFPGLDIKPQTFFERLAGKVQVTGDGIDLDLNLDRPNPAESRLVVTAVFRVTGGSSPINRQQWTSRVLDLFDKLKQYIMASG